MKKKIKSIALLGLSVVMLLLVFKVIFDHHVQTITVYSVNKELKPQEKIEVDELVAIEIPKAMKNDNQYTKREEVLNKYVRLEHHIYPGDVLSKQNIIKKNNEEDILLGLKPDESMIGVEAGSLESLGGTLKKGHRVDIFSSYKNTKNQKEDLVAENIRVIGVKDRKGMTVEAGKTSAKTVLLAVKKDKVKDFIAAQNNGRLVVVGRVR
ncbi:Flp pilus assembly protein CpaB [Erysipelothrix urinaevulpis]|uniref:Flp pilus assembly protein CpaB n=1 Tax=Erysipelothrix urinaevulpis TaxID=2683717 RepID=UPI001357CF23|nr:RcpC/CpaB family pilus assembly protein [Erysipelothrix urinaevulpis]